MGRLVKCGEEQRSEVALRRLSVKSEQPPRRGTMRPVVSGFSFLYMEHKTGLYLNTA